MSDEQEPKPTPNPEPQDEIRAPLRALQMDVAELRKYTAVLARTLANHSAQFGKHAEGLQEEIGQLHGGILLIEGTTQRIARVLGALPDAQPAGGRRDPTPTDQHELPGGVVLEVPKSTQNRLANLVTIAKVLWWVGAVVFGAAGWILHLLHRAGR